MKLAATAIIAILLSSPLAANDDLIKLSAEDAARLNGKSLAITKHQRPSFVAMTPGKASFALLGAGAMIAAGSVITDDVPADALALGRGRQAVKEGRAAAWKAQKHAAKAAKKK